MLSIIQLVAPSWAALPGGESAHWSYAAAGERVGQRRERKSDRERERGGRLK